MGSALSAMGTSSKHSRAVQCLELFLARMLFLTPPFKNNRYVTQAEKANMAVTGDRRYSNLASSAGAIR